MRARRFNAAAAGYQAFLDQLNEASKVKGRRPTSGPRIAPRCGRRPSSHRELSISLTPDARGLDIFTIYDLSLENSDILGITSVVVRCTYLES